MNVSFLNPVHLNFRGVSRGFVMPENKTGSDRVEISFEGMNFSKIRPINLEAAKNITGIHCPGCGVKMMSQQDFETLIKRAENINSTKELVELLTEYKKFIPTNMRKILSNTDNAQDYENKTIREYISEHRSEAFIRKRERVHRAKDFLIEYARNIDESLRADFISKAEKITSTEPYTVYKDRVLELVQNYNIPVEEQNAIKKRTLKDPATSSNYFNIFNVKDYKDISDNELVKTIIQRIFSHAIPSIRPIEKYPDFIEHPHNKLLLCKNCSPNTSKYVFWKSDTNPKLKDNIYKYLSDIARLMGEHKIESNRRYIDTFCHVTNILSGGKIKFKDNEINRLQNLRYLTARHEEFAPIAQTKIDIPCAECGSTLLPHEIRGNIEDELQDCCSPYEYAQVLEKYRKYTGKYSKDFADEFLRIIKNNPNISNEEFIETFQKRANRILKNDTINAIKKYNEGREYVRKHRTIEELHLYDRVNRIAYDYLRSKKFEDYDYMKFFTECFKDINLKDTPKGISVLISDIHRICYKASLARRNSLYDMDDNDAIHTFLFNFFKSDVATADHLIAAAKGGGSGKDNLIALCKGCNTLKSNKSINSWYSHNLDVRRNFLSQLKVIDGMAKSGELEGFNGWAKNIARIMYEKTNHAFDKRAEFD